MVISLELDVLLRAQIIQVLFVGDIAAVQMTT